MLWTLQCPPVKNQTESTLNTKSDYWYFFLECIEITRTSNSRNGESCSQASCLCESLHVVLRISKSQFAHSRAAREPRSKILFPKYFPEIFRDTRRGPSAFGQACRSGVKDAFDGNECEIATPAAADKPGGVALNIQHTGAAAAAFRQIRRWQDS
jgi:hypothetical protein